jgi:hypothetical protein
VTIFDHATPLLGEGNKKAPVKTRAYFRLVAGVGFEPTTFRFCVYVIISMGYKFKM